MNLCVLEIDMVERYGKKITNKLLKVNIYYINNNSSKQKKIKKKIIKKI
jgi:hypothetical protein